MIRRLAPDDVALLKELRLGALADAPSAFGSTYEREVLRTDEQWRHLLRPDGNPTFVWEHDGVAHGMVVGARDEIDRGVVHLYAMWVRPSARGRGAADALVTTVVSWAREQSARIVRLDVASGNQRAERLYLRHGFVRTGRSSVRERDGLVEHLMEVELR